MRNRDRENTVQSGHPGGRGARAGQGRAQKLLSQRFSGKQQKGKTEGNKQMGKAEDHGL